jgi:hypothetical protein
MAWQWDDGLHEILSTDPISRLETTEIARFVAIDGLTKRGLVRFEQEILWLRSVNCRVVYVHGGEDLKNGTQTCDSGRYMSAVESAIKYGLEDCERFSINSSSTLSLEIRAWCEDTPVLALPDNANTYIGTVKRYRAVPDDWLVPDSGAADGMKRLRMTSSDPEIIWCSTFSAARCMRLTEAFKESWSLPPARGSA